MTYDVIAFLNRKKNPAGFPIQPAPKKQLNFSSVLDKTFTGGKISKAIEVANKFLKQTPEQQSLQIKAATGQIAVDTSQIPKYKDIQLRSPTEIERLKEPAVPAEELGYVSPKPEIIPETARQFLREGALGFLVETPEEKGRRTLQNQLEKAALSKTLQGKQLTAGEQEAQKIAQEKSFERAFGVVGELSPLSRTAKKLIEKLGQKATPSLIKNVEGFLAKQAPDVLKLKETELLAKLSLELKGLTEQAKKSTKGFNWKERGFISSVKEELPELKVSGQYVPRSTDRLAMKAKNLIKEDLSAAEKMAQGTDDNAIAATAELLKHYDEQAALATDQAIKDVLYQKAADLANEKAAQLTELGRSVQAASILGRLTPEGQVKFAAREIQKYNEQVAKNTSGLFGLRKKIPELTGEQAQKIINEMKDIQGMTEGTEKAVRFQKLQNYISDMVPSGTMRKIIAVWKAGLLTGIKTSGLNIFSNLSHAITETTKDIPAVAIDKVASLFTGKRTKTLTLKGTGSGIMEGFQKGWRYLKTGYDERNIAQKLDYKKVNFGKSKIAKVIQKYEEGVFKLIGAEDQPFYYGAKARSIADQAIAQAKTKKLKGKAFDDFVDNLIQNPTDEMARYSVLDAETAVFQNKTALGEGAKAIQRIPLAEFVVPFGRTPSSVAMQVINYSPLGLVKPIERIVKLIKTGQFDQRLFSQEAGRAITGTVILAAGAQLFKKGLVSLSYPTTERERNQWQLEGRKENSIKMGGKWRSAQVLGPAGNLLIIGGHFQNKLQESGSPTAALSNATIGGLKSFTEQTFLQGIQQLSEAITDPQRSAEGYFSRFFSSFIPTIISDIARSTDPLERRISGTGIKAFGEQAKSRIPIVRQQLEPQITALGEEQKRKGSFLEVMADPTRPTEEIATPLVLELRRLWNSGYKVTPTALGDKRGYDILAPEQNTELWKKAGEITKNKLEALVKNKRYLKMADDEKAKTIEDFTKKSKLNARAGMILELTAGLEGEALKNKLSELKKGGLMTREVFNKYLELR